MIYTLCWESKKIKIDIKVNREQKIAETVLVLLDGGILPADFKREREHLFSDREETYIDIDLSYEQAGIYNGDILYIR